MISLVLFDCVSILKTCRNGDKEHAFIGFLLKIFSGSVEDSVISTYDTLCLLHGTGVAESSLGTCDILRVLHGTGVGVSFSNTFDTLSLLHSAVSKLGAPLLETGNISASVSELSQIGLNIFRCKLKSIASP